MNGEYMERSGGFNDYQYLSSVCDSVCSKPKYTYIDVDKLIDDNILLSGKIYILNEEMTKKDEQIADKASIIESLNTKLKDRETTINKYMKDLIGIRKENADYLSEKIQLLGENRKLKAQNAELIGEDSRKKIV